jgi:hypothetical protein
MPKIRQFTCPKCGHTEAKVVWEGRKFCSRKCQQSTPLKERFEKCIDKTSSPHGCHLWTQAVNLPPNPPYGRFKYKGRERKAHQWSWELYRGPIPRGMLVCHNCPGGDNPSCVNPDHLFIGTHKDNTQDAVRKGRMRGIRGMKIPKLQGENHYNHKLSNEKVIWIRTRPFSAAKMGRVLMVSKQTVLAALHRKTWTHV